VAAIGTVDYSTPARRPANSRLDCGRLEDDFDLEMPDWRPFLSRMLQLLALKKSNGY
jgi:dTDP-4-dehydrorhamnose reductase